jgi:hypothetical protein
MGSLPQGSYGKPPIGKLWEASHSFREASHREEALWVAEEAEEELWEEALWGEALWEEGSRVSALAWSKKLGPKRWRAPRRSVSKTLLKSA